MLTETLENTRDTYRSLYACIFNRSSQLYSCDRPYEFIVVYDFIDMNKVYEKNNPVYDLLIYFRIFKVQQS